MKRSYLIINVQILQNSQTSNTNLCYLDKYFLSNPYIFRPTYKIN